MQSATSSLLLRAWMPQNNRGEAPGRAVLTTLLWTVLRPLEQPQHPGHPASPRAAVRLVLWVFQMPFLSQITSDAQGAGDNMGHYPERLTTALRGQRQPVPWRAAGVYVESQHSTVAPMCFHTAAGSCRAAVAALSCWCGGCSVQAEVFPPC